MIFKGKKGMVAILILSILFSVIMGTLYIKLQSKEAQFNASLGQTQMELIDKYIEGEKALFYVDQASKYAIYRAIYDLSLNGGFFEYKCGSYKGYGLWQSETEDLEYCSPDYKKDFGKFIGDRLDSYLNKEIFDITFPMNNYDFVFEEQEKTKIHGIATLPLSINITCGRDKTFCGIYRVKPSFTHEISYKLNDYKIIKERLNKISEECKTEQDMIDNEKLKDCVYGKIGEHTGLDWSTTPRMAPIKGKEDRNFSFEVNSNKKMPLNEDNIIYKLAISIPDKAPPPKIENLKIEKSGNNVKLSWDENKALDVASYNIYYNSKINVPIPSDILNNINNLIKIEVDPTKTSYDISIEQRKIYYFTVTAIDEVENEIKQEINTVRYP